MKGCKLLSVVRLTGPGWKKKISWAFYILYPFMIIRFVAVFLLFCFSCRPSDRIACPHIKGQKMRESTARYSRVKKPEPQSSLVSTKTNDRKTSDNFFKTTSRDVKKAVDIEEWDCPRPNAAKNQKIARKMEKRYKANMRKKVEPDSLSIVR